MVILKKQTKITKIFRKRATIKQSATEDCDELQEEVQQLEQKLKEKQNELFQIQRNCCRQKPAPIKKKSGTIVKPQKIILSNSIVGMKRKIEVLSMLTGVEVLSYEQDDHCSIVYHLQQGTEHPMQHGLRIDMNTESKEISKCCLPIGLNVKAVVEDYDNIMLPECLCALRKALVAYYDRLEQFKALKLLLNIEAELFKTLDSTHIEISFFVKSHAEEEDEQIKVVLYLDYRVYDIHPKTYSFNETALPDDVLEMLKQQCSVFKKKPLRKAFRKAFMQGIGTYSLVQHLGPNRPEQPERPRKRFRPNKGNYNNDDTFLPEDCSDQGEEDEIYSE